MPNPASGIFTSVAYKVEATYGTAPGQSGATLLRRETASLDLTKDSYQSNEIRTDQQVADLRHGVRRASGTLKGDLAPGSYKDIFSAALRRDFSALTAASGVSVTIGAASAGVYPLSRATGSWLTDGFKVGHVIRLSVGSLNASNLSKNLLIVDITSALAASVIVLNGSTLVPEGPIAGCTVTATGKQTWMPVSGHTDRSYSIERWYADLVQSELLLGCKFPKISVSLPPTGIASVSVEVMGQDIAETSAKRGGIAPTAQYFTSPTAASTAGSLAAVNGVLRMGGATVATVTGLSLDIASAYSGEPVVGSNVVPFQFAGRMSVTGKATAFFDSVTLRDAFINETEIELVAAFSADNSAAAAFVSFVMPRVKLNSATKSDGEAGIQLDISFQALLNSAGGAGIKSEQTTLLIQDSAA
jgi:hypothetical protein